MILLPLLSGSDSTSFPLMFLFLDLLVLWFLVLSGFWLSPFLLSMLNVLIYPQGVQIFPIFSRHLRFEFVDLLILGFLHLNLKNLTLSLPLAVLWIRWRLLGICFKLKSVGICFLIWALILICFLGSGSWFGLGFWIVAEAYGSWFWISWLWLLCPPHVCWFVPMNFRICLLGCCSVPWLGCPFVLLVCAMRPCAALFAWAVSVSHCAIGLSCYPFACVTANVVAAPLSWWWSPGYIADFFCWAIERGSEANCSQSCKS